MSNQTARYSDEKLAEFKTIIEENLHSAEEQIETLQAAVDKRKTQVTDSNAGFSEGGKHFQEQAKNEQLIRRMEGQVIDLRAALARIEDGSYGIDENSGELIREARLKALPTATFDIVPPKK